MEPTCLAIILCDYVIEDRATRNKSLIGIFNRIHSASFPAHHPRMILFLSLTDGRGKTDLEVFLERGETRREIFKAGGQVAFQDPKSVIDLVFDLRGLRFDEPGPYVAGVRTKSGKVLAERLFHVEKTQTPHPPGGQEPQGQG